MTATNRLGGKALVVGANGGIGSAVAIALTDASIDTALMGRNEAAIDALAATCRQSGAAAFPLICDISKVDTIEAAVDEAIDRLGGLNYLVNCAGISSHGKLHETDLLGSEAILARLLTLHEVEPASWKRRSSLLATRRMTTFQRFHQATVYQLGQATTAR